MSVVKSLVGGLAGMLLVSCVGSVSSAPKKAVDGEIDGFDGSFELDAGGAGGGNTGGGNTGGGTGDSGKAVENIDEAGVSNDGGAGGTDAAVVQDPPIVPKVNDCSGLGAAGVFQDITPPEVKAGIGKVQFETGTFAIAVDPVNQGTIYVGTRVQKFWKSTDCGATWKHISTGRNGAAVDSGMNWTVVVDPQDPQIVYTASGYGTNGLYKSPNGGVDWDLVWPPPSQPELAKAFQYNFANVVALDPTNHLHVLLTFHESCKPPHPATCIAESMNGGSTWKLLDGRPEWNGNEGQVIFFLDSPSRWLWGSQVNGFWRTGDSGATWQQIPGMETTHLQGSQLLRTKAGKFYVAAADGIWSSADGTAASWKRIPDTGSIIGGLVTNGTNMFASTCYFPDVCEPKYLRSAESDGQKWTAMAGPKLNQGGTLAYDEGHHLLYSSNLLDGLWRVVAP